MGVVPVSKRHYTSEERKSENVQKKKKKNSLHVTIIWDAVLQILEKQED